MPHCAPRPKSPASAPRGRTPSALPEEYPIAAGTHSGDAGRHLKACGRSERRFRAAAERYSSAVGCAQIAQFCNFGNVAQLEKAGREFLAELARRAPLLPGVDTLAFIDIDSMQKRVYGHDKQGARFGHTKIQGKPLLVRGLNARPG